MSGSARDRILDETASESTRRGDSPEEAMLEKPLSGGGYRGLRATKRPVTRMLSYTLKRWVLTTVISISIAVVLKVYSSKAVMSKKVKREFNAIITGLSIMLGLSVASSLNGMVGDLRWWILSRRHRSRRKVELILQAERMTHLVSLGFRSRRNTVRIATISWLMILIATQVGVASLGLCYSTDSNQKTALLSPGRISIPDMSSVQTNKIVSSKSLAMGAQQYTANSYGTVSIAYSAQNITNTPKAGAIWSNGDPLMFCGDTSCRYYFHETSTESILDADSNPTTVITPRYLDVSTTCSSWRVTSGGNGTTRNITVSTEIGEETVNIPVANGVYETTYMTNTSTNCGEGCSEVFAFEASATAPWFYRCNVTVGRVVNATRSEHQVSSNFTALVSASIALQGYEASSLVNDTNFQYQVYPAESIFGTPVNGSVTVMAFLMSRFTIGAVAATADNNDLQVILGNAPLLGSMLSVSHWEMIFLILSLIVSIQLLLGLATTYLANRVVIPERDLLETAQVLRCMTNHYHPEESGVGGRSLSGDKKIKTTWIYKDAKVAEGVFDLHMEGQSGCVDMGGSET